MGFEHPAPLLLLEMCVALLVVMLFKAVDSGELLGLIFVTHQHPKWGCVFPYPANNRCLNFLPYLIHCIFYGSFLSWP